VSITFKLLTHYLAMCKNVIFQQYSTVISIERLIFQSLPYFHQIKIVNYGRLLAHVTVAVTWPHSARVAAALDSEMDHSSSAWWVIDRVVPYTDSMLLFVYFEHSL